MVVLDVFRRQFFTDSGRPVEAVQGSHFSVQVRYLKSQELALLKCSGSQGVFVEPRCMDASMPSDEYQVVWIPQASCSEVLHHAQCEAMSVGVARSGRRFGIRVLAQHFQGVFQKIGTRSTHDLALWSLAFWKRPEDARKSFCLLELTGTSSSTCPYC